MSDSRMGERRHELLAEVFTLVDRCLCAAGCSPTLAALAAGEVADLLADHWGGQTICFPKDARRKLSERELLVYERYDGRNLGELARAYGTSERTIRNYVARVRQRIARSRDGRQIDWIDSPASPVKR